jgi:putative oxidoreductase
MPEPMLPRSSGSQRSAPVLLFPALEGLYARGHVVTYVILRAAFGLTIVTHGIPKLIGTAHGSMANPLQASTNLIEHSLGLPFASQLAVLVAILETFGGLAVAVGVATRVFAPMLAMQMVAICLALGPTYPWIDRGIEYPILLCCIALLITFNGAPYWSVDSRRGCEL